jgi:hypothetical protein
MVSTYSWSGVAAIIDFHVRRISLELATGTNRPDLRALPYPGANWDNLHWPNTTWH